MTQRAVAVGTIAAKNYLSFARVLAGSFRRHHPEVPFFLLLADEVDGRFDPAREPFQLLRLAELPLPASERLRFLSSRQQVAVAAKPWFLRHLLDRGFGAVLFLDPDVLVLAGLAPLLAAIERHSIVLTPHLLAPLAGPDRAARELNILLSGVYNGGVLGVSGAPEARRFLDWWGERLRTHCRHAVAEGMLYDQRWLDLIPGFFAGAHVYRDPGVNVGHWNLPERAPVVRDGACRLFHFSGYSPDEPRVVSRYSHRLTMESVAAAAGLFARYRRDLLAAGWRATRNWPYAWERFDNGVPIPEIARELYREAPETCGDPFAAGPPESFFRWLNEPVNGGADRARPVTRLWHAVWHRRPDVQRAYPDPLGADRAAFLRWTRRFGRREHGVPAGL